ncbi:Campylobacter phage CGC-2007, Cje0229 [uncultured Caudovirales phage]|uniref:Campylobacter phage CGC-2007, Cje0229 n=1 Tax=uncultured Caudovirales phage TaxID=2100421 RepID=A0A6J5SDC9_9CAUD|nr:Campylobacter phage CGC-2007, Cje0229 [uncultured Caudovirales phage]
MSDFKTRLVIAMLPESEDQSWILLEDLVYQSDLFGEIKVPVGFVTNFVSFEALKNIGQRPAVVHDYCYYSGRLSREDADDMLCEALRTVGVNGLLAESMHIACRLFGTTHYRSGL